MELSRPFRFALVALPWAVLLAGGSPARAQGGSWLDVPDMPTPRRLHAAASEGGNLYVFGGCGSPCFGPPLHTSAEEETTVEAYSPQGGWSRKKNRMPTILFGAAAAAPGNGKIYTFGGYVSGNVVQEYDPRNDTWKIRKPMPTPRYGLAAVALDGRIYVLGGSGPSATLEIYDPKENTWTSGLPMPTPRVFLAAAVLDRKIYAIGGSPDCCGDSQTDAVEIYDPDTKRWEAGPRLPSARQVSAAVGVNGNIYVFGGFIPGSGVQADTLVYDPRTGWTFGTPIPVARDQAPAALIGSDAYVPGGSVDCHCRALSETDVFVSGLVCTKKGPAAASAGEIVTYSIQIDNLGPEAVEGVTLTDPPPEGLVFIPDGTKPCGARFPCALGTLAPGESRSVDVKFQVSAAGSCDSGSEITNVAEVSAAAIGAIECRAKPLTVLGGQDPPPTCTKTGPASASDDVAYEVTVSNPGCKSMSDVVLSDPTPAGLELVGASCGKLPCKLGSLDPGESLKATLSFRVAPGCSDRASVVNEAQVSEEGGLAGTCSLETVLEADLAVEVIAPDVVFEEATFDLGVKVSNAGPATARHTTLSLDLQDAGSVTGLPPECKAVSGISGRFECALGDLACGDLVTLRFEVQAPACADCAPPGPILTTAEVASEVPDRYPLNNSGQAKTKVKCKGGLAIEKTGSPDMVAPCEKLSYQITVRNTGCSGAAGVTVKDVAPDGLDDLRWCQGEQCVPAVPGPLAAQVDLPAGDSAVFLLQGHVSPEFHGTLVNKASAEHPALGKVEAVETTEVVPKPAVAGCCEGIAGSFLEGSIVTYTFVLINGGPAVQMDNPGDEFMDELPHALSLLGASASRGEVLTKLGMVTWNGSLGVGETVTIRIKAAIKPNTAGLTVCNKAFVIFDKDGNGENETCTAIEPCCFQVAAGAVDPLEIPALSELAACALALALAALSLWRLRRPSAGR